MLNLIKSIPWAAFWWWVSEVAKVLTPVVLGGFAYVIAKRQWITAHNKLRLDLYEKRREVFDDLTMFFAHRPSGKAPSTKDWLPVQNRLVGSRYLFGDDARELFKEIEITIGAAAKNIAMSLPPETEYLTRNEYLRMFYALPLDLPEGFQKRLQDTLSPYLDFEFID